MRLFIATEAGACFGVNRALDMVEALSSKVHGPIHTLGPLIHNPQVVEKLKHKGVDVISSSNDVRGKAVVLRTHGVTPQEEEEAKRSHEIVIDATCPFVIRAHKAAETLKSEGYQVLVLGEKGHAEVLGTLGHAPGAVCIETTKDIDALTLKKKVGLVVQTTQVEAHLAEIVRYLAPRVNELRVFNTICEATEKRQDAARVLSQNVDAMIVIGGKNSANTTRLAEICREYCSHTYHVETPDELDITAFSDDLDVGITAGASTPQYQIDELCAYLTQFFPNARRMGN